MDQPAHPEALVNHSHRFEEIDSLRGIAALSVVAAHMISLWGTSLAPWFVNARNSPAGILLNALLAVYLFFIMSGFVLFLPYKKQGKRQPYRTYITKRICRIYLPYLVALTLAATADYFWARAIPNVMPFNGGWVKPFSWTSLGKHILFLGVFQADEFNVAFWSLVQEMRISLIYPLVALIVLRFSFLRAFLLGLLLVSICGTGMVHSRHWYLATGCYLGMFILGAALAQHFNMVLGWFKRSISIRIIAAIFCVMLQTMESKLPPRFFHPWWILPASALQVVTVLILAMSTATFRRFLLLTPLRWLGKVSYSLYLLHGTVLYSMVCLFWDRVNHPLLLFSAVAVSLILSEFFYRYVEVPSIALGRKLTQQRASNPTTATLSH